MRNAGITGKRIPILTAVLAAQLALVLVSTLGGDDRGAFRSEEPLLRFSVRDVEEIHVEAGDERVVLRKKGRSWRLPDHYDFPADGDDVERLLERLEKLEKGWPVATTGGAAKRFKVTEEAFERRIVLSSDGEPTAELFVGTSPGFRKVHAREADSDEIHAVDLSAYEASAVNDDWIDPGVLERESGELTRVTVGDLTLEREGEAWRLADLAEDRETDLTASSSLVDKVAKLRIESVLGTEEDPAYRQDDPTLRVDLLPVQGPVVTYTFSQPEGETYYVLKASDRPHYMRVAPYTMDSITETSREQLVQAVSPEEEASQTDTVEAEQVEPSAEEGGAGG